MTIVGLRKPEDIPISYISDSAAELAQMAASAGHVTLAYLLRMAALEAKRLCGNAMQTRSRDNDKVAGTK